MTFDIMLKNNNTIYMINKYTGEENAKESVEEAAGTRFHVFF